MHVILVVLSFLLFCFYQIIMAKIEVKQINAPITKLGEGPHWDIERQCLYFVDILDAKVFRYALAEDKTYSASIDGIKYIGFITPVENSPNEFVIGAGPNLIIINWDGRSADAKVVRILGALGENEQKNRFNDGKADPKGRIFAGTMLQEEFGDIMSSSNGAFYRFDSDQKSFKLLKKNITISNGMAWNEKTKKFYYIDSKNLDVKEFDYLENGDLANETVLISLMDSDGKNPGYVADGMTIDENGCLYVATFGGSKILKIDPMTKKIIDEIKLPVQQITSAAFGGPNLDILYVTTCGVEFTTPQPPSAGALFKVTGLGVKGTKMYNAVI